MSRQSALRIRMVLDDQSDARPKRLVQPWWRGHAGCEIQLFVMNLLPLRFADQSAERRRSARRPGGVGESVVVENDEIGSQANVRRLCGQSFHRAQGPSERV